MLLRALQNNQYAASHRAHFKSIQWCPPPDVEITDIAEIVNSTKQRAYETARSGETLQRNPHGCHGIPGITAFKCVVDDGCADLNEHLLFDGCPRQSIDDIARRGIELQRGGDVAGSMFGRGAHFAQNASKSDLYTTCAERTADANSRICAMQALSAA